MTLFLKIITLIYGKSKSSIGLIFCILFC